jgi:DnaJ-class molecular chaperone
MIELDFDLQTETCPECEGKCFVLVQDVPVKTMGSGGFADMQLPCPACHGDGFRVRENNE